MSDVEQDSPRPSPLSSGGAPAPAPRLLAPPQPADPDDAAPPADHPSEALPQPEPGTTAPSGGAGGPASAQPPLRVERPGEVVFSAGRLSLRRLYQLEQDVSQLPGAGQASVDIQDDGQVVVHVSPGAEERVRQY